MPPSVLLYHEQTRRVIFRARPQLGFWLMSHTSGSR